MIATVALLALGFALTAQAGPRLYDGSLLISGYNNDTTTGAASPFTYNTGFVVPQGNNHHCNTKPFHAQGTYAGGNWAFTIPAYGGQLGTFHSSASNMVPPGCGSSLYGVGSPLTGKGTIETTGLISVSQGPRGFTIPKSDIAAITMGASAKYIGQPIVFGSYFLNLKNDAGDFGIGKGMAKYSTSPAFVMPEAPGSIAVVPGTSRFGGTMRLLGTMYSVEGFYSPDPVDTNIANYTWLQDYHGITASRTAGAIVAPYYAAANNQYIGRKGKYVASTTVEAVNMSWTTGTVTITATGGNLRTLMQRGGGDERSEFGAGQIQMVSPMLTRWIGPSTDFYTGDVAHLVIKVAPEPHEWMLLGAGLSMLGLLYRAKRRSR